MKKVLLFTALAAALTAGLAQANEKLVVAATPVPHAEILEQERDAVVTKLAHNILEHGIGDAVRRAVDAGQFRMPAIGKAADMAFHQLASALEQGFHVRVAC